MILKNKPTKPERKTEEIRKTYWYDAFISDILAAIQGDLYEVFNYTLVEIHELTLTDITVIEPVRECDDSLYLVSVTTFPESNADITFRMQKFKNELELYDQWCIENADEIAIENRNRAERKKQTKDASTVLKLKRMTDEVNKLNAEIKELTTTT